MTRDEWLSEVTLTSCFALEIPELMKMTGGEFSDMFFYTCRVSEPTSQQRSQLAKFRFRHILDEVNLIGEFQVLTSVTCDNEIRNAIDVDLDKVAKIATVSFKHDRFHQDPAVSVVSADQIKKRWVSDAFRTDSKRKLWVSDSVGRVDGFCLTAGSSPNIRIDLIAVDVDCRGRGIGGLLVGALPRLYGRPFISVQAGTQVENVESLRLYRRLGMRAMSYKSVYHRGNI